MEPLTQGIMLYGVLLVSLVVHEAAHAVTAYWGGDKTAYLGGQVTLNPIPHMQREPFGTLLLPISVLYFSGATMTIGFAHAPIDAMWAQRNPKKAALMSAAGPTSNFLLVLLAVFVLKILFWQDLIEVGQLYHNLFNPFEDCFVPTDGAQDGFIRAACRICTTFILLNLLLGFLNLIPVPPLDGAGVVSGLFPAMNRFYGSLRGFMELLPILALFWFIFNYGWHYLQYPLSWCMHLVKL